MTEAMPFLQKAILLSYDPRPLGRGVFSCICGFRMRKREGEAVRRTDGGSREEITYSDKKKLLNC